MIVSMLSVCLVQQQTLRYAAGKRERFIRSGSRPGPSGGSWAQQRRAEPHDLPEPSLRMHGRRGRTRSRKPAPRMRCAISTSPPETRRLPMRSASNRRSSHPHSASAALRTTIPAPTKLSTSHATSPGSCSAKQKPKFLTKFGGGSSQSRITRPPIPPACGCDRAACAIASGHPGSTRLSSSKKAIQGALASRTPRRRAGVSLVRLLGRAADRAGTGAIDGPQPHPPSGQCWHCRQRVRTTPQPMRCADKAERTASRLAARL